MRYSSFCTDAAGGGAVLPGAAPGCAMGTGMTMLEPTPTAPKVLSSVYSDVNDLDRLEDASLKKFGVESIESACLNPFSAV